MRREKMNLLIAQKMKSDSGEQINPGEASETVGRDVQPT
jgi:hypothetical protein